MTSAYDRASMSEVDWLVRLRWIAICAQAAALGIAALALGITLPLGSLAAILLALAASNLALALRPRRALVGPVILVDTCALTATLALAGGPSNPFSIAYLVYVTLCAVAAPGAYTWATVALSAIGYGLLFVTSPSDPHAHHHGGGGDVFSLHLQGMWIAFTIAALLIAAFVTRVSRALAAEREAAARAARLLGLTTLAAGAAHELATPLSTIKTIAGELDRALKEGGDLAALRSDVALVRAEVDRSQSVLERLSLRAGELRGETPEPVRIDALVEAIADLPEAARARMDVHCDAPERRARVPRRALGQVVSSLVRNALDASETQVELRLAVEAGALVVVVADQGEGMSPESLARAGEPFFTTKEPGRGMGLGLFLARTLVTHLGGTLAIQSELGKGTRVTVRVPEVAEARPAT
jgi:two-component system sensor histidine kinase RegB